MVARLVGRQREAMSDDELSIKQCALDQLASDLPFVEVTASEVIDVSRVRGMVDGDAVIRSDETVPSDRWYVALEVTYENLANTTLYRVWRSEASLQALLILLK